MAFETNCMQIKNGEFDINHFNSCMSSILAPNEEFPAISIDCSVMAETFIIENNISMSPEELVYLTNAYGMCSNSQGAFDDYVCDEIQVHLLAQFSEQYGISISGSEAQELLDDINTCDGEEFEIATWTALGNALFLVKSDGNGGSFLVSKTCKSSFEYVPVGLGYTTQVDNVRHAYSNGLFSIIEYRIPEVCIQVRGEDKYDQPLTADKAAELTAFAMDNARLALFDKIQSGFIDTNLQARNEFKSVFVSSLLDLTGGNATSSISYMACSGNIPSNTYKMNPLGGNTLCISL